MRVLIVGSIMLLARCNQSRAADDNGNYMVVGEGHATSENRNARKSQNNGQDPSLEQWLFGYVTSFNRWVSSMMNIARGSNHDSLAGWTDDYCSRTQSRMFGRGSRG